MRVAKALSECRGLTLLAWWVEECKLRVAAVAGAYMSWGQSGLWVLVTGGYLCGGTGQRLWVSGAWGVRPCAGPQACWCHLQRWAEHVCDSWLWLCIENSIHRMSQRQKVA